VIADNVEADPIDGASPLTVCAEHGKEPERLFGSVDATTHLLRSEANRKRLLAAIENIEAGRNLIEVPL
jgi:hypothetical protein